MNKLLLYILGVVAVLGLLFFGLWRIEKMAGQIATLESAKAQLEQAVSEQANTIDGIKRQAQIQDNLNAQLQKATGLHYENNIKATDSIQNAPTDWANAQLPDSVWDALELVGRGLQSKNTNSNSTKVRIGSSTP